MTNNSYSKAIAQKLSNQQLKKEITYLKSHGASEKDIQELKKDVHNWFCADRCFYEKKQSLDTYCGEPTEESRNPLYKHAMEHLTCYIVIEDKHRLEWIDNLDNNERREYLQNLSKENQIMLTEFVINEKSYTEIAAQTGKCLKTVSSRIKKILKHLKPIYMDEYKKHEKYHAYAEERKQQKKSNKKSGKVQTEDCADEK